MNEELYYDEGVLYEEILQRMLSQVPDNVDKREGSIIYDALAPAAVEMLLMYQRANIIMQETFVDTASLDGLKKRCRERGVTIKGATNSIVRGSFTPDTLQIPIGTRFNCDAVNFVVTEKESDGIYRLSCESSGISGNIYSGRLIPIYDINGLETAEIVACLIPGEAEDTEEELRERYYASLKSSAYGGNIADYQSKVNDLPGVGGVKVYPVWNGGGTVKLAIIDASFHAPSEELIQEVQTAVDPEPNQGEGVGIAPIGHVVTVAGVSWLAVRVAMSITFVSEASFEDYKGKIESAIGEYFLSLAESWADSEVLVVRISQIENRVLNLPFVVDVGKTAINGKEENLLLQGDYIPKLEGLESI